MQLHSLNALFKKKIFFKDQFLKTLFEYLQAYLIFVFRLQRKKNYMYVYFEQKKSVEKIFTIMSTIFKKWKVQITTNLLLNRFFPSFFLSMHIVLASFFFQNVILNQILTSFFIQIEILQRFYSVYRNIFNSFS